MFDNLTMEIFYYSVIPVAIIALITLLILIFSKKNKDYYKYNYIIKVSLIIMISLVLPLMIGYTLWLIQRYLTKGIILSNMVYIVILCSIIIALIALLIIICKKLYINLNRKTDTEKEF